MNNTYLFKDKELVEFMMSFQSGYNPHNISTVVERQGVYRVRFTSQWVVILNPPVGIDDCCVIKLMDESDYSSLLHMLDIIIDNCNKKQSSPLNWVRKMTNYSLELERSMMHYQGLSQPGLDT